MDDTLDAYVLGKAWELQRPNREKRSSFVRFAENGGVVGYSNANEASWDMLDGRLVFRNVRGDETAVSGEVSVVGGRITITMMQRDPPDMVAHYLVERREPFVDFTQVSPERDLASLIVQHRAFRGQCRLAQKGFSLPDLGTIVPVAVSEQTLPRLEELGIKVLGRYGSGNVLFVDEQMQKVDLSIDFHNRHYNTVVLDKDSNVRGEIQFEGDENLAVFGGSATDRTVRLSAYFRHGAAALLLGSGGSAGHLHVWLEGPDRAVQVGDDFLFSWGVWLRTADPHGLVDLDSGALVNHPLDITVEDHVWLGQDSIIMPGVVVGRGSVVGARSVVTKTLPATCVAVGSPARVIRQRTSWTRDARPDAQIVGALQQRFPGPAEASLPANAGVPWYPSIYGRVGEEPG